VVAIVNASFSFKILFIAQHIGKFVHQVGAEIAFVVDAEDAGSSVGTLFGGDQDHPVGAAGAVDGRRGPVLQDRNGFDILDSQVIQIPSGNTVDHHQG